MRVSSTSVFRLARSRGDGTAGSVLFFPDLIEVVEGDGRDLALLRCHRWSTRRRRRCGVGSSLAAFCVGCLTARERLPARAAGRSYAQQCVALAAGNAPLACQICQIWLALRKTLASARGPGSSVLAPRRPTHDPGPRPVHAERRRCLARVGSLARARTTAGHAAAASLKRSRGANSTRRVSGEHTTGNKGQLQRPVLVSTSAREAGLALFPGAVLVAEGGSIAAVGVSNNCIATAPAPGGNETSQNQAMELAVCATPLTPVAAARAAVTLRRMKAKRKTAKERSSLHNQRPKLRGRRPS